MELLRKLWEMLGGRFCQRCYWPTMQNSDETGEILCSFCEELKWQIKKVEAEGRWCPDDNSKLKIEVRQDYVVGCCPQCGEVWCSWCNITLIDFLIQLAEMRQIELSFGRADAI